MSDLRQLVTLKGLNTVYKDVRDRLSKLSTVYHAKGNLEWASLLDHTSSVYTDGTITSNDVYNLTEVPADLSDNTSRVDIYNNINVKVTDELVKEITEGTFTSDITIETFDKYWTILGGIFEEATDEVPGLIKTGMTGVDTPEDPSLTTSVSRGLKLTDSSISESHDTSHQAYVDIPIASDSTYGLLNTGAQKIKGDKSLEGSLSVDTLEVGNSPTVINNLNVSTSFKIGSISISENDGVLTFSID